ncbi:MAG TPA: serine/threonine-protein kinase [Kofleriaceae bacterium]|nr:serine/threonine-protein kinase [Kofleriaceae bacterium]
MTASAQKPLVQHLTGGKVGKYTLKAVLGQGGYGDVHLGVPRTGPSVAVKILHATASRDEDTIARFKREADTAQRLDHPNIVRILDVGSSRGRHYLVMELVRGGSLRQLLDRKDVPPDKVIAALAEVATALAFAHAQGVVHRDVKPENVLLTKAGRAKVADFGLARAVDQSSLTTEGRLLGTAAYMSPEQVKGQRATAASDVYAMGILLYEAITGARPFTADSQLGYLYQHAEVVPARPVIRGRYPAVLASLALDCLAKHPDDRPTMAEVAKRLDTASHARSHLARGLAIAILLLAFLCGLAIALPSLLDPLCGDWSGGAQFRWVQQRARAAHAAVFDEPAGKPHTRPHERR